MLDIYVSSIFLTGEKSLKIPTLETSFLNYIDDKFKDRVNIGLRQFNYPKQKELDELYKEWLKENKKESL